MIDLPRLQNANLVHSIDYHPSLGSTNDRAIELASRGEIKLPLLVITDEQTAGRGRGANRWLSSAGALTFSLALEAPPDRLPQSRWPEVALATGLAVGRALRQGAPAADIRLKWPNDVYLDGKKVCGILSESVPGWRDRLVVGIGVNINNRLASPTASNPSAADIQHTAISLIEHDGQTRDLTSVLIDLLDAFDHAWNQLTGPEAAALLADYRTFCFLTGKTVTAADAAGHKTIGHCLGIDATGRLQLQTESGHKSLASATILTWDP